MSDPSGLWAAIEATPIAVFVRESQWAYPLLETVHMVGLGLLFGGIVMMDLRLLGLSRRLPATAMARHLLPWAWAGFAVNALSGALLFASDAAEFAANRAFQAKMALILLAGLNMALFHLRTFRAWAGWDTGTLPPPAARLAAVLSICLWLGVIAAGRMMAYWE